LVIKASVTSKRGGHIGGLLSATEILTILFFQALAGIARVPLAIMWFGIGAGPLLFVVANLAFFIMFFTTAVASRPFPRS
jgi:NitT/TauT family transport system permease protein/taurine transport system permease protein